MNSCFLLLFPIFNGINLLFFIEYKCELQYIDTIDSFWKKNQYMILVQLRKRDMKNILFLIRKILKHFVIAHLLKIIGNVVVENIVKFN